LFEEALVALFPVQYAVVGWRAPLHLLAVRTRERRPHAAHHPHPVLVGTLLLLIGLVNLDLDNGFACYNGCPDADRAAIIAGRLAVDIPLAILSALP